MAEQILTEALQLLTQEAVVVEQVIRLHQVTAAPALLSSNTPYQAKPYLRSKALLSGHARQVLPALTILGLLGEVGVVVDWAVAVVPVGLELALLCRLAQVQSTR
jgi:hypothetical protein